MDQSISVKILLLTTFITCLKDIPAIPSPSQFKFRGQADLLGRNGGGGGEARVYHASSSIILISTNIYPRQIIHISQQRPRKGVYIYIVADNKTDKKLVSERELDVKPQLWPGGAQLSKDLAHPKL